MLRTIFFLVVLGAIGYGIFYAWETFRLGPADQVGDQISETEEADGERSLTTVYVTNGKGYRDKEIVPLLLWADPFVQYDGLSFLNATVAESKKHARQVLYDAEFRPDDGLFQYINPFLIVRQYYFSRRILNGDIFLKVVVSIPRNQQDAIELALLFRNLSAINFEMCIRNDTILGCNIEVIDEDGNSIWRSGTGRSFIITEFGWEILGVREHRGNFYYVGRGDGPSYRRERSGTDLFLQGKFNRTNLL